MRAQKITVGIITETLSIDSVPSLLVRMMECLGNEMHNGSLTADDGDSITWTTTQTPVEF